MPRYQYHLHQLRAVQSMILTLRAMPLNLLRRKEHSKTGIMYFTSLAIRSWKFDFVSVHLLKLIKALLFCTGRVTFTVVAAQLTDTMLCACANAGPGIPHRSKRLGNNRCKLADGSLVLVTNRKLGTCIRHGLHGKSSSRRVRRKHPA